MSAGFAYNNIIYIRLPEINTRFAHILGKMCRIRLVLVFSGSSELTVIDELKLLKFI